MPDKPPKQEAANASWDNYWQGARSAAAFSSQGVSHPALVQFWRDFFGQMTDPASRRVIDIASGNGAVIATAVEVFGESSPELTCLDVSEAAVNTIRERYPEVHGIVADAADMALESGSYEIATSQFGVEYAGVAAIHEMARLVGGGGQLVLLMHSRQGGIYRECAASLDAVNRLKDSAFIPLAIDMFKAGFAACRGADRAPYDAAARRLAPAITALEDIMRDHGSHVAGDTLLQLHENVDRIHQRMPQHDPAEVLNWLSRLDAELGAFGGRMRSMCTAALDRPAFDNLCSELRESGFMIERAEALSFSPDGLPLAWALVAQRQ